MFLLQIRSPSCADKLPDHCHKKLLSQIRQDVMYLASCNHSNVQQPLNATLKLFEWSSPNLSLSIGKNIQETFDARKTTVINNDNNWILQSVKHMTMHCTFLLQTNFCQQSLWQFFDCSSKMLTGVFMQHLRHVKIKFWQE